MPTRHCETSPQPRASETAAPDTFTHDLLATLNLLLVRKRQYDFERRAGGEVTWAQDSVLRTLVDQGPSSISYLAADASVAAPTMTVAIRRLERQGWVRRTTPDHDRRVKVIAITDLGREAYRASMSTLVDALAARVETMNADDQAAIRQAIPALGRMLNGQDTR